jgi:hypothetical protein
MKPGINFNIPASDYHQAPGVSNSMLKQLSRSPAHLVEYLAHPPEQTPAMLMGSILHQMVLEPELPEFWRVKPSGMDGRSKAGREWMESGGSAPVVSWDDYQRIRGMVSSVSSHNTAQLALGMGNAEVSVFTRFDLGGVVDRKCRIDFVNDAGSLIDIKTTEDARPEAFARTAWNLKYHMQAAYYLDCWNAARPEGDAEKTNFVFVAVEKDPPYAVAVYDLSPDAISQGRSEYIKLLQLYMECRDTNTWPAYPPEVQTLDLPRWAKQRENLF